MAAEEERSTAPSANGAGHHTEIIAADLPADADVAQNSAQTKVSAAEKRRQRKKKNKQTKQAERCATSDMLHLTSHEAAERHILTSIRAVGLLN